MAEYAITGDVATLLGVDHAAGDPAALWVEASQPIILDGSTGRLGGSIRVDLADDGTFTQDGLPETVEGVAPLYRLRVDSHSLRRAGKKKGEITRWFPLTADRDLVWVVENYVDVTVISTEVAADIEAAAALGATNDTATASFVEDTGSATHAALSATIATGVADEVSTAGTPARAALDGRYALVGASLTQAPGKNLYDKDADNGADTFYNNSGDVITLGGWYASAKIPATEGAAYTINNPRQIVTFNGSTMVRYINNASETALSVTIAAGETHFAFNVSAANRDTAQAEAGVVATAYEPYGVQVQRLLANGDYLDDQLAALAATAERPSGVKVFRDGNELLVRSAFDATQDIIMPVRLSAGDNNVVRLDGTTLTGPAVCAATEADIDLWPTLSATVTGIHVTGDDIAPVRIGALYVGANHGWPSCWNITMTAHGKTNADRGSTWSDGTRTYTLVKVVDANTVRVVGQYTGTTTVTVNITAPAATLTHVAGATNTADITIAGGVVATQLWPSVHAQTVDVRLDGTPLADGTSTGEALTITETYTIVSFKGFVDWSRANIGSDPYANLPSMIQFARVSNTYRFTAAQVVVGQTLTMLDESGSMMMGVTQSGLLSRQGGVGSVVQFMAGVGTVSGLNFSTWATLALASSATIALANQLDANTPPQRMVQWHLNASSERLYGIEVGILPVMDGKPATRKANGSDTTGWYISASEKNYPQIAWAKTLAAGASLSGMAYRRYLPPTARPETVISDGSRYWLTIDDPDAHAAPQIARVPQIAGRALTTIGATTVTPAKTYVTGEGVTYTNTAPGHLLAEAVVDTSV